MCVCVCVLELKCETSEVNTRLAYFNKLRECRELYLSLAVTSAKVSEEIACFCNASQFLPLNHNLIAIHAWIFTKQKIMLSIK